MQILFKAILGFAAISTCADGDEVRAVVGRGITDYFNEKYQQADEQFDTAIRYEASPLAYYFRGLSALKMGNREGAIADFQRGAQYEIAQIQPHDLSIDESNRTYTVSRSLERIQGSDRRLLDTYRRPAICEARDVQSYKRQELARLAAWEDQQSRLAKAEADAEAKRRLGLQALVNAVVNIRGVDYRILEVKEVPGGIRALRVIDPKVNLSNEGYENTWLNTPEGMLHGKAIADYKVRTVARMFPARFIQQLSHPDPVVDLAYSPLRDILTIPAVAEQDWERWRIIQEEQRQAELVRAQAERERQLIQAERDYYERLHQEAVSKVRREQRRQDQAAEAMVNAATRAGTYAFVAKGGDFLLKETRFKKTGAVVSVVASWRRDENIKAAIEFGLPELKPHEVTALQVFASQLIDGELSLENFLKDNGKGAIKNAISEYNEGLGNAAEAVDLMHSFSTKLHAARQ